MNISNYKLGDICDIKVTKRIKYQSDISQSYKYYISKDNYVFCDILQIEKKCILLQKINEPYLILTSKCSCSPNYFVLTIKEDIVDNDELLLGQIYNCLLENIDKIKEKYNGNIQSILPKKDIEDFEIIINF
jgi:hypothetical protein